jgi:hypothetical protein
MTKHLFILSILSMSVFSSNVNHFNTVEGLSYPSGYAYGYFASNHETMDQQYPYYIHSNVNQSFTKIFYTKTGTNNYTLFQTLGGITNRYKLAEEEEYTGGDLRVKMIFNHATLETDGSTFSNSWDYTGGTGGFYFPRYFGDYPETEASIGDHDGSSTGISKKVSITFYNDTSIDYFLYIDLSNNSLDVPFRYTYKSDYLTFSTSKSIYNQILIPAFSTTEIYTSTTSAIRNIRSWFLYYAEGNQIWETGYNDGIDDGYDAGYEDGEQTGYSSGYNDGASDNYSSAYSDGYTAGYSDGMGDEYDEGFIDGGNSAFLGNFDKWIVPAIIIVLVGGGFITIWSRKRRDSD